MERIKDILYNKNDILIALVIICIAAFVIQNRINVIMDYSGTALASSGSNVQEPANGDGNGDGGGENGAVTDQGTSGGGVTGDGGQDAGSGSQSGNNDSKTPDTDTTGSSEKAPGTNASLYIAAGSTGSQIAESLVQAGMIQEKQQFYDALVNAAAEKKLRAGNFIIPVGSTPAQIVQILTK